MLKSDSPEDSPLGRASTYCSFYNPDLLFPIPRLAKREEIGVSSESLPFVGEDVWNAYELSWLNMRGKPQVAIGVFRVPAESPRLIESKSLKLYLNSFNQTKFSDSKDVSARLSSDLSLAAGASVTVEVTPLNERPTRSTCYPVGISLDELDIEVTTYSPVPELLSADVARTVDDEVLYSHLLKSNCLVTGQPDWGMVAIRYSGPAIDREGLLRYIISFREHNEFHEQCVERIFMDIKRHCAPGKLAVWARYTRRGGLDINPFRATEMGLEPPNEYEVRQ